MSSNPEVLRVIHLLGVFLILSGLASLWGVAVESPKGVHKKWRFPLALIHGIGMGLVLITGLGLAPGWAGWVSGKFVIWLVLGGSMILAKRKAKIGWILPLGWSLLATFAASLALLKPF